MIENNKLPKKIDVIGEKTAERYAVIKGLLQTDVKQTEIAKLTDYTPEHISRLKKKLLNIQLVTPKRIKKAIKAVEHFANVENYQGDDRIKPSDVINASKIFLDRQYPVTQVIENTSKIDISIDMSTYRTNIIDVIGVKDVTPKSVSSGDNPSSVNLQVSSDSVSG